MSDLFFQEYEQSEAAPLMSAEQKHFQEVVEEHKTDLQRWIEHKREYEKRKYQIEVFREIVWQSLPWYTKLWRTVKSWFEREDV